MKNLIKYAFIFALTLVIIACNTSKEAKDTEVEVEDNAEAEEITVVHELGETVVHKNPEKIVVFDFGMLDTLDYLNIDVVAVPQMNIPSYLDKFNGDEYENIGSLKEPDFEKIANLDPDLIIISGRQAELYDELSKLGPVVYLGVDTTRYIDSFKENVTIIGEIFEKEQEVEGKLAEIDETITEVNENAEAANKNSLILLANDDKISAYGENSRFGLIHDVLGIPAVDTDIDASTHGMNVTFEYVADKDPDILYVIDRSAAIGEESAAKHIVENELVKNIKAIKNDDVYYLNPDIWYLSGGGLISVDQMIEEIAKSID